MSNLALLTCWLALFESPSAPSPADDAAHPPPGNPPDNGPPTAPRARPRIHPRELVGYGSLLASGLLVSAWLWAGVIRQRDIMGNWFPPGDWALDLLIGTALGAVFAVLVYRLERFIPALQDIEHIFLATLDLQALQPHHILFFGVLAGVPEEVFFRGAMQSAWGVVITALVFGALHAATPAYFVYATVAGGLLGLLTVWREGLWAAIAAHTVIDMIMFGLLKRTWRQSQAAARADAPDRITPLE